MKVEKSPQTKGPARADFQPAPNPPRRILAVDDNVDIRRLNAEVLTGAGYKVDAAQDGAVAWSALQLLDYDLLITDNQMPTVTGVELIMKLRAEDLTLPVILMSATMPTEEINAYPWLQIQATLLKPYSIVELLITVKEVLRMTPEDRDQFTRPRNWQNLPPAVIEQITFPPLGERAAVPDRRPAHAARRILVVDDDRATREVSVELLAGSGFDVETARDGAAGWEALQTRSYDLVLTDNQMPRMTGLEMIRKLRAARMTLPVIMATGALPAQAFDRQPWLRPDATLERPFTSDELLRTVKKILGPDDGRDDQKESLIPKHL